MPEPIPTNRRARIRAGARRITRDVVEGAPVPEHPGFSSRRSAWWVLALSCASFALHLWIADGIRSTADGWPISWIYLITHWPNALTQQSLILATAATMVGFAVATSGFREISTGQKIPLNVALYSSIAAVIPVVLAILCFALLIALGIAAVALAIFIAIGIAGAFE